MKNKFNLFYLSAALFYLAAITTFIVGNHNPMGFTWLCLGSVFLCLGSVKLNNTKEDKDTKENKEE